MSDYLVSWASPDHWRNDVDVVWDDTESGRRKPVGEFALQQGASLSRHHPDFRSAIELGVLRLVLELVEGWDFVTYSSCEGHLIETVPVEVFSEAYCGIVTFANRQITVIEHMVERAVRNIELEHVRVRVRRRNLYGPTTSHSAIDIVFERGTPGTDWARYRTDADLAVGKLVDIFSTMRKGECG